MRVKGVLIDLDGTLVDSLPVYDETLRDVLKEFNLDISSEKFDFLGEHPDEIVRKIIKKYNLNISLEEFKKKRNEYFSKKLDKIKLFPGAIDLINFLKEKNIKMGLVTASQREVTNMILENLKVKDIFDVIVTSDDVEKSKPNPDPYILAMRRLNLSPYEVFAIEDSIYGILSAKRAGINVIAVLTGVNRRSEIKMLNPYKICKNLKEVKKVLEEELSRL